MWVRVWMWIYVSVFESVSVSVLVSILYYMCVCDCLRFCTCVFICILLPVSLSSSHFPVVTIQFYFPVWKHPKRNTEKARTRKRLKRNTHLVLSFSSLLAYPTLVLLPFIHFTFIIRTKHIQFIWRVHLQHQK